MKLPKGIVPPPARGPRVARKAGPHDSRPNRQRTRAAAKAAAIRREVAA